MLPHILDVCDGVARIGNLAHNGDKPDADLTDHTAPTGLLRVEVTLPSVAPRTQPLWAKCRPRVLPHIGIEIRPVHKPRRITRDEHPCLEVPIPETLIEQPCRVFLFGV